MKTNSDQVGATKTGGVERRSKISLFGLPLLHIVPRASGGKTKTAKGIIAVGPSAVGIIAIGMRAVGVISMGTYSAGLVSLGAFSLGMLSLGGIPVGLVAIGGCPIGYYAMGGEPMGVHLLSKTDRDPQAIEFFKGMLGAWVEGFSKLGF